MKGVGLLSMDGSTMIFLKPSDVKQIEPFGNGSLLYLNWPETKRFYVRNSPAKVSAAFVWGITDNSWE
mgnify:CR=1 FL=1